MSQIQRDGNVSDNCVLDAEEHNMFTQLASKSGGQQAELNQIINSAIAQHAQRRMDRTQQLLEDEPEYQRTDYNTLIDQAQQCNDGQMEPHVYAEVMQNAEEMMATIQHLDWQLSSTKQILKKYKDLSVAQQLHINA